MFTNEQFCTKGITENVPIITQTFLWHMIDTMEVPQKDYFQVFKLSAYDNMQKIIHIQEQPEYCKEYCVKLCDAPIFVGKIFVIDDITHSTILLAEEY